MAKKGAREGREKRGAQVGREGLRRLPQGKHWQREREERRAEGAWGDGEQRRKTARVLLGGKAPSASLCSVFPVVRGIQMVCAECTGGYGVSQHYPPHSLCVSYPVACPGFCWVYQSPGIEPGGPLCLPMLCAPFGVPKSAVLLPAGSLWCLVLVL